MVDSPDVGARRGPEFPPTPSSGDGIAPFSHADPRPNGSEGGRLPMDAHLTDDQIAYRDRFRAWLDENLAPDAIEPADDVEAAKRWKRKLHRAGYAGVAWPKAYGGQGLTPVEHAIVAAELGFYGVPEGADVIGAEVVGPILLSHGTEAQKMRHLPRLLAGEEVWCQGFSEPNAGSDLAALKTRAVRDGGDWIVNGRKIWTSHAHQADLCVVLARTDPNAPGRDGFTLFLVDMRAPGTSIRPIVQITGRREFNEVFFDDVRVSDAMRVGTVDAGWPLAKAVLSYERASTSLHRNARYRREFDDLLAIYRRADASGSRDRDNADLRQRLAETYADIEIHRYHDLRTAELLASGREPGPEASIVKLHWSELHQRMSELALDLLGADAMGDSPEAERWRDLYLESRSDTLYAGTSEIQRNIIADRILELPR